MLCPSDPKRIDIIHALEKHPYNVNELTAELRIPQPMTSRHLKILRERGLVQSTRHGVSVTYALSDPRLIQALELLNDISVIHKVNAFRRWRNYGGIHAIKVVHYSCIGILLVCRIPWLATATVKAQCGSQARRGIAMKCWDRWPSSRRHELACVTCIWRFLLYLPCWKSAGS
jgi:DNA-binding transcriptional ArsR family regulator